MILEEVVKPKNPYETPQSLMDSMVSFAKTSFDPKSQVLPMWTVIGEDGKAYVYMIPFVESGDKNMAARVVREACDKHKATMIGFMAETWTVSGDDKDKEQLTSVPPSEHPDRKEAIYMIVETASGKSISGMMIINRNVDDGVLEPFVQHDPATTTSGRFANMFPKKSVH